MTDQNALTVSGAPAMSIAEAANRYNSLVEFTKNLMKKDKDYGIIPGSDKPTLLKPGAEKLRTFFGLQAPITVVDKIEDWDKGFFTYTYRCDVIHKGDVIATCEASANSKEKKYRYRNIVEWEATEEDKASAVKVQEKTARTGRKYKLYTIENREPYDLVNTLQKMAQKRAFVGAILIAANASEFFTQDIEDLSIMEGEFTDEPKPQPKPGPKDNGKRPYAPETIKEKLAQMAEHASSYEASDAQRNLLRYGLELCFPGESKDIIENSRKKLLLYLTGEYSTREVSGAYVKVIIDKWLEMAKDDGGEYTISEFAPAEADAIIRQHSKDNGQGELI